MQLRRRRATIREIDCPDCLGEEPGMETCETCGGSGVILEDDDRESWFDTMEEYRGEK